MFVVFDGGAEFRTTFPMFNFKLFPVSILMRVSEIISSNAFACHTIIIIIIFIDDKFLFYIFCSAATFFVGIGNAFAK